MDPSSFRILLAKSAKLGLSGPYFQAHDALRSKEHINFKTNAHKFQKISYSSIISFVCVGKEEIHK